MVNKAIPNTETNLVDFPREKWKKGGSDGNDGGGGMDDLSKRVERTEESIGQIKLDLAKLTTRSEAFATKSDILGLKSEFNGEITSLRTDLKGEVSSLKAVLKTDTATIRTDIQRELVSIHKEITNQTKWVAATMIGTAGIALAVARYLFG